MNKKTNVLSAKAGVFAKLSPASQQKILGLVEVLLSELNIEEFRDFLLYYSWECNSRDEVPEGAPFQFQDLIWNFENAVMTIVDREFPDGKVSEDVMALAS